MSTNQSYAAGLSAAVTTYQTAYQDLYRSQLPGAYQAWTRIITGNTMNVDLRWLSNTPVMRKWLGARVEKTMRVNQTSYTLEKYEATTTVNRMDLQYEGNFSAIQDGLNTFLQNNLTAYDLAVSTALDGSSGAGPTCFDTLALFSTAHTQGPSAGTQSNLSSGTNLSWGNFDAARAAMAGFKFENGEPAYIKPTHMRVGTALESRAKQYLQAKDRVTFTNMLGAESTTAVQNATLMPNVWAGELTLIVDPRIPSSGTGAFYWDLYDLSKPGLRPIVLYEGRKPVPVIQNQMEGERRFRTDQFVFGLEGDFTVGAGHWMCGYRATGTA
jgi:phage major head subunit gpT-like protein